MKRLSIFFLAFLTFWMSTWMVTDIHVFSNADQSHAIHSAQQTQSGSEIKSADQDHSQHCGVCSYDHGGHIGQALATRSFIAESIPAQNTAKFTLNSDFWYSRNLMPELRPPIA